MPTRKSKSGNSKGGRSKPSSRSKTLKLLENAHKRHEEIKVPDLPVVVNEETYDISTDLDSKFTQKFIENEERIKIALSKSGRHPIIKEKAQEFIDRQISPIRRQAAKDLIDNTHYITMREIFHIIEELILKTYARIDLSKEIYLYCGKNNKSFYFFACISLYFIKKHKLKMPNFVSVISINLLLEIEDCPLIIVDDASYSGAQLSNLLNDLFYGVVIEEKSPPSNIYVLLASVNDQSLSRLLKVPNSRSTRFLQYITFIDTPFHIMYLDEYKYNSLVREVGIERYFYINLYFNVFLAQHTNIALYLDHKVADMTSTYKNVYLYGPIVPPNYDINEVNQFYSEPVYLHQFFDRDINRELYADFLTENPIFLTEYPRYANIPLTFTSTDESYKSIIKSIPSFLIHKALTIDIQDREYSLNNDEIQLEFCPFIKGCNKSTKLKEIIKNQLVLNSKYLFFMFDLTAQSLNDYGEDLYTQTRKETRQVIKLLDSHRCPENWYKNGILQLI